MQVLRRNAGTDKLAAKSDGMQVLRGNSGTDKLAAAGGGMQVLRGNSGTGKPAAPPKKNDDSFPFQMSELHIQLRCGPPWWYTHSWAP